MTLPTPVDAPPMSMRGTVTGQCAWLSIDGKFGLFWRDLALN